MDRREGMREEGSGAAAAEPVSKAGPGKRCGNTG